MNYTLMGVSALTKPPTSKLFKLKQWLTLSDTAKHLSGICGEEVTEADILRLGLDKHLKLSVYFVNKTYARPGHWEHCSGDIRTSIEKLKSATPPIDEKTILTILAIAEKKHPKLEDNKVVTIEDIWDLPMLGGGKVRH
jgi:hypothetical protein